MSSEPTIQQLFDLSGKTAIVTGGTGHLGQVMSRALAEAGANVVVTSRDVSRAQEAAGKLPILNNARHLGLRLDHMEPDSLDADYSVAVEHFGTIDILVNNGNEHSKSDWRDVKADEFTRQLANCTGYFLLSRLQRDHAVGKGRSASIIMLGSMYGLVGSYPDAYEGVVPASPVAYHALKGGILQMTRHLSVYWAVDGVRVNAISPGPFPGAGVSKVMVDRLVKKSPMKRVGQPHELKGAIVFFASDASSYVTGQNLVVDGGWTAW